MFNSSGTGGFPWFLHYVTSVHIKKESRQVCNIASEDVGGRDL